MLRNGQAETVEQDVLGFVRGGDAAQMDRPLAPVGQHGGQDDVAALDFGQLLDQRSWCIAQSRSLHPLGQRFPTSLARCFAV